MTTEYILPMMLWAFIAFSLLLCGVSMYRGNVDMIALFCIKYDPNKVADKESLAKWVGSNLIFLGICTSILSISRYFGQTAIGWLWLLAFVITGFRLSIASKKYEKK